MDSEAAQLRVVDGLVPAEGSGMYASDLGTRQRKPGGGGRRLVAQDAEEPGPDERACAPSGSGPTGGHRNGDYRSHRGRGKGSSEAGETARPALPQERTG